MWKDIKSIIEVFDCVVEQGGIICTLQIYQVVAEKTPVVCWQTHVNRWSMPPLKQSRITMHPCWIPLSTENQAESLPLTLTQHSTPSQSLNTRLTSLSGTPVFLRILHNAKWSTELKTVLKSIKAINMWQSL